jgi:hypothetical protein
MKPWIQCVLTHWKSGFTAFGTAVIRLGFFARGSAALPILPTFLARFSVAFQEIPGTIPPRAGTAD